MGQVFFCLFVFCFVFVFSSRWGKDFFLIKFVFNTCFQMKLR